MCGRLVLAQRNGHVRDGGRIIRWRYVGRFSIVAAERRRSTSQPRRDHNLSVICFSWYTKKRGLIVRVHVQSTHRKFNGEGASSSHEVLEHKTCAPLSLDESVHIAKHINHIGIRPTPTSACKPLRKRGTEVTAIPNIQMWIAMRIRLFVQEDGYIVPSYMDC